MGTIAQTSVPASALLKTWRGGRHPDAWEHYSDCFSVVVARPVTLEAYVFAFYTTPSFRLERWILGMLLRKPSTDAEARQLAAGHCDQFAAWTVAARTDTQILLADFRDQTRSWLAVTPLTSGADSKTQLQFGSGVAVPASSLALPGKGPPEMSRAFRWLSGFHVGYSRVLLSGARRALERGVDVRTGR